MKLALVLFLMGAVFLCAAGLKPLFDFTRFPLRSWTLAEGCLGILIVLGPGLFAVFSFSHHPAEAGRFFLFRLIGIAALSGFPLSLLWASLFRELAHFFL